MHSGLCCRRGAAVARRAGGIARCTSRSICTRCTKANEHKRNVAWTSSKRVTTRNQSKRVTKGVTRGISRASSNRASSKGVKEDVAGSKGCEHRPFRGLCVGGAQHATQRTWGTRASSVGRVVRHGAAVGYTPGCFGRFRAQFATISGCFAWSVLLSSLIFHFPTKYSILLKEQAGFAVNKSSKCSWILKTQRVSITIWHKKHTAQANLEISYLDFNG